MKPHLFATVALLTFGLAAPAGSIGIVSLDLDPGTAGVQDTLEVMTGSFFQVDLVLSDFAPAMLQSFQARLDFDAAVVLGVGASDGGLLAAPIFELGLDVLPGQIFFSELSLGAASLAEGVLASFQLQAIAAGESSLDVSEILLSGPLGKPIGIGEIRGGRVVSAIPEPTAALLFAAGIGVVARRVHQPAATPR